MLEWLKANLATILISLALLAAGVFVVIRMVKDRKKGGCSCGCADCPMRGKCHKQ